MGRKKNLIILDNGKNVYPEELEAFFMEHLDYIHEVVVFEAEKEINGRPQKIIAAAFQVDAADFPDLDAAGLTEKMNKDVTALNHLLPAYKRVQDVFVSTEEFEINSTRKVIRSKVEERYYAHLKADKQ